MEAIEQVLLTQAQAHPAFAPQDAFKLLYQNEYGCEHLVDDGTAAQGIAQELQAVAFDADKPPYESIGNGLVRFELAALRDDAAIHALATLFVRSAQGWQASWPSMLRKVDALEALTKQGALPFDSATLAPAIAAYRAEGCPPVHHSPEYRDANQPHYRVVREAYARVFPLCEAISGRLQQGLYTVVSIDGRCGSGKSTLGALLQQLYDCAVLKMDDFFLPAAARTAQRLATPGGNTDHERFVAEVLPAVLAAEEIRFRPYDCVRGKQGRVKQLNPQPLLVVEGSYSQHPAFSDYAHLRVFATCDDATQRARLQAREGDGAGRFIDEWIPLEEAYIQAFAPQERAHFVYDTHESTGSTGGFQCQRTSNKN